MMPDALMDEIEETDDFYMSAPEFIRESIRWRLCLEDDDTY
jgi:hypothetical protein